MNYLTEAARVAVRERRGLIFALAANGATLEEIGREIGVSGSRAGQILGGIWRAIYRAADRRFPLPNWVYWSNLPVPEDGILFRGGDPRARPLAAEVAFPDYVYYPAIDAVGAASPMLLSYLPEVFARFGFTSDFRCDARHAQAVSCGPEGDRVAVVSLVDGNRVLSLAEAVSAVVAECDRLNSIES